MRFSRRLPMLLVCLFALLIASVSLAQTASTTSSLSGTVVSAGSPMPGVTVTVSSPSLQGTRTAVTGDGGGYTFQALPPGDYTVKFSLEGMQPVTRKVRLTLTQAAHADADLKVGTVEEAITVTASAPAVLETTQVGANFNQSNVDKLPVARNIRQTVLLAPGVNPNGVNQQITINGAPSVENVFLVNGVVVNENLRGQPHNLFIEDSIQETSVLTAGISAEYGRFTGGVVSTITKSGGNEFSGSLRDSMTNADWTAGIKDPAITFVAPDKVNQVYEATLGGRILRDRLWFFAAGRKAKTGVGTSTFRTNISYTNGFDEKRYEGKLTAQITSKHNLVGSYLDLTNTETNNAFTPIYDEASIVPSRQLPNRLQTVSYNGVLTNNLLAEAAWSEKTFAFIASGGRFADFGRGTFIADQVTGARMNSPVFCGICTQENRDSSSVGGKASYFLSTRNLGNHTIAFGGDHFWETRVSNNYQSTSQFQISARVAQVASDPTKVVPVFNSGTQIAWNPIFVLTPGTDLSSDGVFVNDRWDYNSRLSFNIGVRYDKNDAKDADGNLVSDDSNYSPRLGAMFDLKGDGRHRVSLSVARYVAKITDGSNVTSTAQAAGNPASFVWAYTGPNVNAIDAAGRTTGPVTSTADAMAIILAWFNANCDSAGKCGTANTNFIASSYPGYSSKFLKPIKSPSADEITVGYGVQISRNAFARLDVVHREWSNFYAGLLNSPAQRAIPPNGVANDFTYTVNDDEFTERRYTGASIQGAWQPGRFNLGGNYTWSKLQGNDVPEGAGTATIRNTPGEIFYPEYLNYAQRNPKGYLGQDRRHRARVWAGYDFTTPIGSINLSALQAYDSGFAYSAIGTVDATGRSAAFRACTATITTNCFNGLPANPGYTLSAAGTSHNYFFSDRGAFRTDSRMATDLALSYTAPALLGKVTFFARADLLNVFDEQTIIDGANLNTDVFTARTTTGFRPFNPKTETPLECPQSNTIAQCTAMGANWQKGPNFGKANAAGSYQTADRSLAPRTYRFTLGLRF